MLEEHEVWNVVSGMTVRPAAEGQAQAEWDRRDFRGRATIVRCLDEKHLRLAGNSTTAAEMWQRLSDEHEMQNSTRNPKHEFIKLKMTPTDSVMDFVERVRELGVELQETAEAVTEMQQVLQVLDNLTPDYDLVKCSFHRQNGLTWRMVLPTLLNAESIFRKRQEERPSAEAFLSRTNRSEQHNWMGVSHPTWQGRPTGGWQDGRECYNCYEAGHLARFCPRIKTFGDNGMDGRRDQPLRGQGPPRDRRT